MLGRSKESANTLQSRAFSHVHEIGKSQRDGITECGNLQDNFEMNEDLSSLGSLSLTHTNFKNLSCVYLLPVVGRQLEVLT